MVILKKMSDYASGQFPSAIPHTQMSDDSSGQFPSARQSTPMSGDAKNNFSIEDLLKDD